MLGIHPRAPEWHTALSFNPCPEWDHLTDWEEGHALRLKYYPRADTLFMEQELVDFLGEGPLEEIKDAVRKFPNLATWQIGPMLVETEEILRDMDKVIASGQYTPITSSTGGFTEAVSSGTPIPPDARILPWEPPKSHPIGERGSAFMNNKFSMTRRSTRLQLVSRSAGRKSTAVNPAKTTRKALATRQPRVSATNSEKKRVSPGLAVRSARSEAERLLQHVSIVVLSARCLFALLPNCRDGTNAYLKILASSYSIAATLSGSASAIAKARRFISPKLLTSHTT